MNQSNFIFFALLLAFVVYVTMRGELPTYMGFFVPNPNAGSTGAQGSTGAAGTPSTQGSATPQNMTIFGLNTGIPALTDAKVLNWLGGLSVPSNVKTGTN